MIDSMALRFRLALVPGLLSLALLPSAQAGARGLPAWGVEQTPNVGGVLNGISVRAHDDIWAVGYDNGEVNSRTLTMHFDGAAWSVVPSPNLPDGNRLSDVVALSPNDVWAVGWTSNPSSLDDRSFSMHWDGTSWSIVDTPQPGGASVDRLEAVDAAGPNDVWATGLYWDAQTHAHSVILHWNGKSWSNVPLRAPSLGVTTPRRVCDSRTGLAGITVVSASDVWAVGDATTCHYGGTAWRQVPSPQPRGEYYELSYPLEDVSAAAPNDVWAVGARVVETYYGVDWDSLAEHWDGTRWTLNTIQLPPGQILYGVDAVAADDVWAVGQDDFGATIVHYDGSAWSHVPTPAAGQGGRLGGVGSAAPDDLWAGGYTFSSGNVIEHAPSSTQGAVVGSTNVGFSTVSWFGAVNGSTQADASGAYEAGGLPAGTYTFTATEPGCGPDSRSVTVEAGATLTEDFHISCGPGPARGPGRAAAGPR
jgi:hypothetical protein